MYENYGKDSLLISDDDIYTIELYDEDAKSFKNGVAYLDGEYYYLYRGEETPDAPYKLKPGIFKDVTTDKYFKVDPTTEEEKAYYTHSDKVSSINPKDVIETLNTRENIVITIPESNKVFNPSLTIEDDILKRLIKKALIIKGVDLDAYANQFENKNSLFNFKQVIKGDKNLSILIFDRGCTAMNLKYTIIVEEKDPENPIGEPIKEPIIATSEDTFDI